MANRKGKNIMIVQKARMEDSPEMPTIVLLQPDKLNPEQIVHVAALEKSGCALIAVTEHKYGRFDPYYGSVTLNDMDSSLLRLFEDLIVDMK